MIDNTEITATWFQKLQNAIQQRFISIEKEFGTKNPEIKRKKWIRPNPDETDGGGGYMFTMKGNIFEKVGVNFSIAHGKFLDEFAKSIPGANENDNKFWASGVSVVSHMKSPLIPAIHMNTRFISTNQQWFGGGMDLTPYHESKNNDSIKFFHNELKNLCNKYDPSYYPNFSRLCAEYFYLKHRKEPRGVGGIFYDYLKDSWDNNFEFTKDVGTNFITIYEQIIRDNVHKKWSKEEKEHQLIKRGRYVEFNLMYDRGTKFGIETEGNIEAIFMSMPPEVKWE